MSGAHSNRCTPEFKQGAVQPYEGRMPVTYAEVARGLGIDAGTLSKWVAQARGDEGSPQSESPFQMAEGLRRPRRENERLKRGNETLLEASAFSAGRQL